MANLLQSATDIVQQPKAKAKLNKQTAATNINNIYLRFMPHIIIAFTLTFLLLIFNIVTKNRQANINHVIEETALLSQGLLNAFNSPDIKKMKDPQLALKAMIERILPASRNFGETHVMLIEGDVIKAEIGNIFNVKINDIVNPVISTLPFHTHGFVQQGDVKVMEIENKNISITKITIKDDVKQIIVARSINRYNIFSRNYVLYYILLLNILLFTYFTYYIHNTKQKQQSNIYGFVQQPDKVISFTKKDRHLQEALDLLNSGFILWDEEDNLVLTNTAFRQLHNFKDQDLRIGMKRQEALQKVNSFRQSLITPLNDALNQSDEMRLEDGRWFQINTSRTKDGGLASIITDISTLKKHEQDQQIQQSELQHKVYELQKARDYLTQQKAKMAETNLQLSEQRESAVQANNAKSNFLANMSHDLRTPLTAIIGYSEMMKEKILGEIGNKSYETYPDSIYTAGLQLLSLVDDILDVSRIEKGKMEIRIEQIQFDEVLEETLPSIFKLAERRNHTIILDIDPELTLKADKRALRLMLQNLLTNAVKFTADGGDIRLIAKHQAHGTSIVVKDNGIGIKEESLAKICNQFEQGEDAYARSFQGSGLGLFITKTLIEMHGGTIKVTSKLNEGTKVSLFIPS